MYEDSDSCEKCIDEEGEERWLGWPSLTSEVVKEGTMRSQV
jgi:hypothetical protein